MRIKFLAITLALALTACGNRPAVNEPTHTLPIATTAATEASLEPSPSQTPTQTPSAPPSETPTQPPTAQPTLAPSATATATATTRPTAPPPAASPTSAGPLSAQIFVANCRSAPTADKPGNVIVQISVEATGGNGVYAYVYQDISTTDKFIEIPWELGSRLLGKVTVNSGDGQSVIVELNVDLKDYECP
jgi:hypothetical protein